jgi:hypothetical protein
MKNTVDLHKLFLNLQTEMVQRLKTHQQAGVHPGSKGDAAETKWRDTLSNYLPKRYCVDKAFVLDSKGAASEQLDIVIYDRQYSPFLFKEENHIYVPAESVYAVFEVKPDITATHVKAAAQKATSVRALHRTNAKIPHLGGKGAKKNLHRIIAGILCLEPGWKDAKYKKTLISHLDGLDDSGRLDLGCVLNGRSFEATYGVFGTDAEISRPESALIFFFLKLIGRLQACGTVPAIQWEQYGKTL